MCNCEDRPCCGCDQNDGIMDEDAIHDLLEQEAANDNFFDDDDESDEDYNDEPDNNMTDGEADADTLKSCGWGCDEDYGDYGSDDY